MKYKELKQEEKDMLVSKDCFLNNKPARIYGRLLNFPIVAQIDGPLKVEFAWLTVQRIINDNSKFVA